MTLLHLALIVAVLFWLWQLIALMRMADAEFPGRYDKPTWAVIMVLLPVAGAMLFGVWKLLNQTDEQTTAIADDLTNLIQADRRERPSSPDTRA